MVERDKPAPYLSSTAIRTGVLMTRNAENFAIGQGIRAAGRNGNLVVCFPSSWRIIIATGVPIQNLTATPRTMSTAASSTFTSSARALPGCEDSSVRKSHNLLSFPQRKLTKPSYDGIITTHASAPSKPLVLLTAVVSAS